MNLSRKWPGLLAGLLVGTVFFEGSGFSFNAMSVRVRSVQVLEIVFLGFLGVLWLLGRWRWRKSPLDYWLLAYLSVNFIAILNSQWKARSLKIFLLLVSLALLYWLVYQLLRNKNDILLAFYVFLAMGTLQVLFGIYQVLAGALNYYRGWSLPIGYMGMVHREYINSVWGRSYGTQVEPDFYGAICMVFALIFFYLYFSVNGKERKWLLTGAVVSLTGLYLSFVRTAWLVFLLLFLLQFVFKKKWPFLKTDWKLSVIVIGVFIGFHLFAMQSVAPIKAIHEFRFAGKDAPSQETDVPKPSSLFNSQNIRFLLIRTSWQDFLQSPVLGNGPGSFTYFNWKYNRGEVEAQKKIAGKAFPQTNPSMLFTVLEDTGIIGFVLFATITVLICLLNSKGIARSGAPPAPQSLALFIGLSALFLSYIMTSGLWLPLTWVFLGLNIASLKGFPEVGVGEGADRSGARACA